MHYFFLEKFLHPADWFVKRLAYTRSVAASSMASISTFDDIFSLFQFIMDGNFSLCSIYNGKNRSYGHTHLNDIK